MDHRNLDKAMEIFTKLIVGEEISSAENIDLYEDYRNNSEVCDILMSVLKKSNVIDVPFRYAPYRNRLSMLKKLMK